MGFLKNSIIKILAPYQYPQVIFAREICKALEKQQQAVILDCPCGNGEVSYHLSRLPGAVVKGVDRDEKPVKRATENFSRKNLIFETADIFSILSEDKLYDVICVVNSLFLLPDHDKLFGLLYARLRNKSAKLIIITPNPESDNFKNFQGLDPSVNKTILNPVQVKTKAEQMCFTMNGVKEIAYASYYGRKELRFFSVLAPFYLLMLDFFKSLTKHKQGNYLMYCFAK